ncbi:MAG: hypothetical protein JOZ51_04470 [Chloroflexi bacterium]|nr:hypothetical protein [Chloroflexota bacterium]
MSDRGSDTGDRSDRPLFKQMDEQERIYAPQQVPGELPQDQERELGVTETVVPGTLATGIDTPIPGAKALEGDLDRDATDRSRP